jgi:hypothetical protein
MNTVRFSAIALVVSATLAAAAASGEAPVPPTDLWREVPALPKEATPPQVAHPTQAVPEEDLELMELMESPLEAPAGPNQRAASAPAPFGTTLTPPVTLTSSSSTDAFTIKETGLGRGLVSVITNTGSGSTAVYGETKGKSAGVRGVASGASGTAGIFTVTTSSNASPAVSANTSGTGSAILGTITKASSNQPAIIGTNTVSAGVGIGVQGIGNNTGVYAVGKGSGYGVFGYAPSGAAGAVGLSTTGVGTFGESSSSIGVLGESSSGIGVYGLSSGSNGVYAFSSSADGVSANSTNGRGITAHSVNSLGIYSSSDHSYGVWGQSTNQFGVIGEDAGSGVGVYGSSGTGYAGYFNGKVAATSYVTVSDRNAKTDFAAVDGAALLERLSRLSITSWVFKDDRNLRHIGPVAQDFHAAFGLNGTDDTHINLADAAGVSMAAIQELNKRLKEKDARIAALEAQVKSMNDTFSARLAKLEERSSAHPQITTAYVPTATRAAAGN